jgi:RsiW-degrading membrane proteinase PrsW (M82 family)
MIKFTILVVLLLCCSLLVREDAIWLRYALQTGLLGVILFAYPNTKDKTHIVAMIFVVVIHLVTSWAFHENTNLWAQQISVIISSPLVTIFIYSFIFLLGYISFKKEDKHA